MKIAIVDDEENSQDIIEKYIREWAGSRHELVEFSRFGSSEGFLFSWEEDKDFALLVLDIEMGEVSGLELARRIRMEDGRIPVLFVTGYDEYMQYGYDVSALHYLLKPVNKDRLFAVLDKMQQAKTDAAETLIVNAGGEVRRIQVNNIMYVEAAGHGSIMHTNVEAAGRGSVLHAASAEFQELQLKESLGAIEKQVLSGGEIIKCHRAYLVGLRFISAIQNSDIVLDNGERLPVSRNQMKNVQQAFLKYYRKQV